MEKSLYDIREVIGSLSTTKNLNVTSFTENSQKVQPGGLFFALQGNQVDGHVFLEQVAGKGALGAVVRVDYQGDAFGLELLRVENPLKALQELARFEIQNFKGLVIGITGSVGKTTTKEFLAHLLESHFRIIKTEKSENGQIGLPLTILNAKFIPDIYVLEMGISLPGEMEKLMHIIQPHKMLITKIASAHLGNFSSLEELAVAKALSCLHSNTDLIWISEQANSFKAFQDIPISKKKVYALDKLSADRSFKKAEKTWELWGQSKKICDFTINFEERHRVEDCLAAISMAMTLGVPLETIQTKTSTLPTAPHRFEHKWRENILYIDDSYNANSESMRAGLENLPQPQENGRKIAVLGEISEQGWYHETAHLEIGEIAAENVDYLFCLGQAAYSLYAAFLKKRPQKAELFEDFDVLKLAVENFVKPGDVVFIKGANKLCLWKLLD